MDNVNKKLKLIKGKVFSLEFAFANTEKSKKDWKKKEYHARLIINETKNSDIFSLPETINSVMHCKEE